MTIARMKLLLSAYINPRYNENSDFFRLDISIMKTMGTFLGKKEQNIIFLIMVPAFQIMLSNKSIKKQIQTLTIILARHEKSG